MDSKEQEQNQYLMANIHNKELIKKGAFINGEWLETSESNRTFAVKDPATGELIATLPDLSLNEVDHAIRCADKTFQDNYKNTLPRQRSQWLLKLYELMLENIEDLAKIITLENGKSLADSTSEVKYAASYFQWYSEEAPRIYGATIQPSISTNRVFTIRQPVGVCAVICPWNFPSAMITRKAAAALATGCTVVVKPDHETPLSALALAALVEKAGFPPGAFNVIISGTRTSEIGTRLCESSLIKKLSFTGSTRVGKILMKQSSSNIKKLSLELGGNAPFIVFEDADVEKAVDQLILCKFRGLGQTCVCANRVYVQTKILDNFVSMLKEKVSAFKIGHGLLKETTHGCLINKQTLEKVEKHKKDAIEKGAKVILGGGPLPDLGPTFYEPCILSNVPKNALVSKEETFGPLCPIFTFDTMQEVIKAANDTEFGLASYVFSKNINTVFKMAESLEAGMVSCNTGIFSDSAVPFGGIKESGFGREGSLYGIEDYTVVKTINVGTL
ncbi:magnesium-activated aldehyde dehydrogenase, cytosolic [Monosporozyma unispora]|nr:succinate semialdehyde dehydrogenase NADP+ linked [Kazachstania unispora]